MRFFADNLVSSGTSRPLPRRKQPRRAIL